MSQGSELLLWRIFRFLARHLYDPRRLVNGRPAEVILPPPLGFRLAFDADQLVTRVVRNESVFEPWLTEFFIANVRSGEVAIDIGANVGYFTILLAKLLGPGGRIIAADPLYGNKLRANLKLNDISRVQIVHAAISDQNGHATIYRPRGEDGAYASLQSSGRRERGTRVRSVTLDSISEEWPSLKWIKMDVEGAEYRVLRGGTTTIARFRPHIVLEWSANALKAMGADEDELFGLLTDSGYELFGSCNNMGPLRLPTSTEDAHTVLATPNARELKLVPWNGAFY